jgi:hypothetical protein
MNYAQKIMDFCRKNRVSTTEVADALGKTGVFPRVLPVSHDQYRVGQVRCIFTANGSNYAVHEQVLPDNIGQLGIAIKLLRHKYPSCFIYTTHTNRHLS